MRTCTTNCYICSNRCLTKGVHRMKSHLSVDWMVTKWWRERWISVAFQPPFSFGTFQWSISQVIIMPNAARTRVDESKGMNAIHSATGIVKNIKKYLVFVLRMLNSVLKTCFLIFYSLFITINWHLNDGFNIKCIQCFKWYLLNTQTKIKSQ